MRKHQTFQTVVFRQLEKLKKKREPYMDNVTVLAEKIKGSLKSISSDLERISDFKEAERQFRKVIYADPNIVLAYFKLGNIYLYQRRFKQATREFNNAIKLLQPRPEQEQVRFCEDFTVDFLLRACKNNLAEINTAVS